MTPANEREVELWSRVWRTPQATEWDRLGVLIEVALYVRRLAEAEKPGASTSSGTLVRQMGESLGLSIAGLRVNRWKIGTPPAAVKPATAEPESAESARPGSRHRFGVIDGAA